MPNNQSVTSQEAPQEVSEPTVAEQVEEIVTKPKKALPDFYETFQIAMELEMEIPNTIELNNTDLIEFKQDGSLRREHPEGNTTLIEAVNRGTVKTIDGEQKYIESLKSALGSFKSSAGDDIYAYRNRSCGTHIHFSFKNQSDNLLWLFDTLDFERDFFHAYMKKFKSDKFMERINSRYCRAPFLFSASGEAAAKSELVRADLKNMSILHFSDEKDRIEGSRYRWLNMEALQRRTGIELRLFPHLQTYAGVHQVLNFTKEVVNNYYWKPATQQKLALLKLYNLNNAASNINKNKLNELKRMVYDVLRVEEKQVNELSGEVRILLAKWIQQQPALINTSNEIL